MPRFFTEWPTWEKLCFILACAIAVTLVAGAAKLGYTHWKIRKYVAVAEKEKRAQAMQRQVSLRCSTSTRQGADSPFGLAAMEKGIEGIWVSRSNTPEPVSRERYRTSFTEPPSAQLGHQSHPSHSSAGARPRQSTSTERTRSAERLPFRPGQFEADSTRSHRSEHPPRSVSKYSAVLPCPERQDSGVSTIEAIDAIYDAAGPIRSYNEHTDISHGVVADVPSSSSSSESSDNDPIAASAPNLLSQKSRPRQESDLDLMHSHRMSLAAETGQLAPRKRPGPSGEWASLTHAQRPSTASEPECYSHRQRSPSPAEGEAQTWSYGNLSSPKLDALPAAVRRSSLPDVTPFATFCKTAPASPHPDLHRPSGSNNPSTHEPRADSASTHVATPSAQREHISLVGLPTHRQTQDTVRLTLDDHHTPKQGSFEHRTSAVIRGHGSGFEILRQGTFQTAPPISLQNNSRSRSSSTESRRKLRKKRRPSEESQTG